MRLYKRMLSILVAVTLSISITGATHTSDVYAKATAASKAVSKIKSNANKRRSKILSSSTAIVKGDNHIPGKTYSGTAYYISNKGSDSNDGLSPETPFATVDPLEKDDNGNFRLHPGDAIFFERGSVWRALELPWDVVGVGGITLSAYGEGEKPAFLGSEENGSGAEKWKLSYSDDSGRKIWVYYKDMPEVAGIVLNDEIPVTRDVAWFDGKKYHQLDADYKKTTGNPYDVNKHLDNMFCFPMLTYSEESVKNLGERVFRYWDEHGRIVFYRGPLYFRCDKGNPGELYDDIEFIEPYAFIDGCADNYTFDNLKIEYSSMTLTTGRSEDHASQGNVLQNLELGWMGGNVVSYASGDESGDTRIELNAGLFGRNGGAISVNGSKCTIRDNYIHDAFGEGIAIETFIGDSSVTDCVISGNLIERSTQGILLCNWDTKVNKNHIFKNISVKNNMVLYAGTNSYVESKREREYFNSMVLQGGPVAEKNLKITGNVFAFATGSLVNVNEWSSKYSRVFSKNTYVQYKKRGKLPHENSLQKSGISINWSPVSLTKKNIKKYLGDKSPKVYLYK